MLREQVYRRLAAALSVSAVLLLGTACTQQPIATIPSASAGPAVLKLTVGTPEVPGGVDPKEGALIAHVYAAALTAAGVSTTVEATPVAAGTEMAAVAAGTLDVAPAFSRESPTELTAELPDGVVLLNPAKATDSDALVVTAVTAEKYQLKSMTDLAAVCDTLIMGGPQDLQDASSGLQGLDSDYDCVPKSYVVLQANSDVSDDSTLWSLLRDDIQIADIHASSPAIEDNSLVVLSDPKELFKSQILVPLVDSNTVPAEVQSVINKVSAALSTEEMVNLNRLALDPHFGGLDEVGTAWLMEKGLIKASS